jgi:hypothetical protein
MNILVAIQREERKLEKEVKKVQKQLNALRSAARALGHTAAVEATGVKKRVLYAAEEQQSQGRLRNAGRRRRSKRRKL